MARRKHARANRKRVRRANKRPDRRMAGRALFVLVRITLWLVMLHDDHN
ncbi:hypothetical protein HUO13_02625 [Saccharopolyspora erythraea]|nr:hypothetical protein [Saccharopolyspora erythraea]QUG99843.1 hypothetical protein HUO13_02625 [Saccharopolyspora erythraea]